MVRSEIIEYIEFTDVKNKISVSNLVTNLTGDLVYGVRSTPTGEFRIDELLGYWRIREYHDPPIEYENFELPEDMDWDDWPYKKNDYNADYFGGTEYVRRRLNNYGIVQFSTWEDTSTHEGGCIPLFTKKLDVFPNHVAVYLWDDVQKIGNNAGQEGFRRIGIRKRFVLTDVTIDSINHDDNYITVNESLSADKYVDCVLIRESTNIDHGYVWHITGNTADTIYLKNTNGLRPNTGPSSADTIFNIVKYENEVSIGYFDNKSMDFYTYKVQKYGSTYVDVTKPSEYVSRFLDDIEVSDSKRKVGWSLFEILYDAENLSVNLRIDKTSVLETDYYLTFDEDTSLTDSYLELFIECGVFEGLEMQLVQTINNADEITPGKQLSGCISYPRIAQGTKRYRLRHVNSTPKDTTVTKPDMTHPLTIHAFDGISEIFKQRVDTGIIGDNNGSGDYIGVDDTDKDIVEIYTASANPHSLSYDPTAESNGHNILVLFSENYVGAVQDNVRDYEIYKILDSSAHSDDSGKLYGRFKLDREVTENLNPSATGKYLYWQMAYSNFAFTADTGNPPSGRKMPYAVRAEVGIKGEDILTIADPTHLRIFVPLEAFTDATGAEEIEYAVDEWDDDKEEWKTIKTGTLTEDNFDEHIFGTKEIVSSDEYVQSVGVRNEDAANPIDGHVEHVFYDLGDEDYNSARFSVTSQFIVAISSPYIYHTNLRKIDFYRYHYNATPTSEYLNIESNKLQVKSNYKDRLWYDQIKHYMDTALIEKNYKTATVPYLTTIALPSEITGTIKVGKYDKLVIQGNNLSDINYLKVTITDTNDTIFNTKFQDLIINESKEIDLSGIDIDNDLQTDTQIKIKVEFITAGYITPTIDVLELHYYLAPTVDSLISNISTIDAGTPIKLSATATHPDPAEQIEYYKFKFSDPLIEIEETSWIDSKDIVHVYTKLLKDSPYEYLPSVKVKDTSEIESKYKAIGTGITVSNAPPAARAFVKPVVGYTSTNFLFDAGYSFDRNEHENPALEGIKEYKFISGDGQDTGWVLSSTRIFTYGSAGEYVATVKVRDYADVEDEISINVVVLPAVTATELTLFNRAEKLDQDFSRDYSSWKTLNKTYAEIDLDIALDERYNISGMGQYQQGLEDIKELETAWREGKYIKILWRDVSRLGYDLSAEGGDKYLYGYITTLKTMREGGEADMHPWQITVVKVDSNQFSD